ncbi:MAG: hypothetical protein HY287_18100 [Planctomycetes bacterium]|nr:hypothetical protein [Planctomycetota bacterium]MBI3836236.1 hypothetical protein [Planctomycetota bacterium]
MERRGFWERMSGWFRPSSGNAARRQNGEGDLLTDLEPANANATETGIMVGAESGAKMRLSRPAQVQRLEEEYIRVAQLVESVGRHIEQQGQRTEQIAGSLNRLAESLAEMPTILRSHTDALSGIRDNLAGTADFTKRIDENLSQLPRIADAQRETMVSIGRGLEASRQSDERITTVLDGCHKGLSQLADATGASAKALQELRWDTASREERVAVIMRDQTRRFMIFAWSAMALAAVAAALGLIGIFK